MGALSQRGDSGQVNPHVLPKCSYILPWSRILQLGKTIINIPDGDSTQIGVCLVSMCVLGEYLCGWRVFVCLESICVLGEYLCGWRGFVCLGSICVLGEHLSENGTSLRSPDWVRLKLHGPMISKHFKTKAIT